MKVKIKSANTAIQGKVVRAGDVVDVPDQYAQSLIHAGIAEPVSESTPKKSPEPAQEHVQKVVRKAKKAAPENK